MSVVTTKDAKQQWDHHSAYQWSYFGEVNKEYISFFLSNKLFGKNLDLGGGWYNYYPNSTVVDFSSEAINHNSAKEKLVFDLDSISSKNKLPFRDNSFNSATMISVWQYLRNPLELIKELKRILIPGGEVYIINDEGAGLEELMHQPTDAEEIAKQIKPTKLNTIIESVIVRDSHFDFKSVCVAMPENTLFGKVSRIRDKKQRMECEKSLEENLAHYEYHQAYALHELRRINRELISFKSYPVTDVLEKYEKKIELFSAEFASITGKQPLITTSKVELELKTAISFDEIHPYLHKTTFSICEDNSLSSLCQKHSVKMCGYISSIIETIDNYLTGKQRFEEQSYFSTNYEENEIYEKNEQLKSDLLRFIGNYPLNEYTRNLQNKVKIKSRKLKG